MRNEREGPGIKGRGWLGGDGSGSGRDAEMRCRCRKEDGKSARVDGNLNVDVYISMLFINSGVRGK